MEDKPIDLGNRYAYRKTKRGTLRMHFDKDGNIDEVMNLTTGRVHSKEMFEKERSEKGEGKSWSEPLFRY